MSVHMYVPSSKYPDAPVANRLGRTFGGVAIGILLFGEAGYALPPGSVENATSFKYPVHYRPVKSATNRSVLQADPDNRVLKELVEAAQELEINGCRAIIGACGYFGNYLPQVRAAVNIPVFMSSLMMLPLMLNSLAPEKKVAVICANGLVLPKSAALKHSGITDLSRLVIAGGITHNIPEVSEQIGKDVGAYNPMQLEREVLAVALQLLKENPSIGAFLLECTLYPPISYSLQRETGLPVWDFITMIDMAHSTVVRQPFNGYI